MWSNCSNSCDLTCNTLACALKCVESDSCFSGCICPYGTVENDNGECVSSGSCKCSYNGGNYSNGDYIIDQVNCKKWYLFLFIKYFLYNNR